MRHFVISRCLESNSGMRRDQMAVSGQNPVRAAELYAQHFADNAPYKFQEEPRGNRMMIEVMEIEVDHTEGVRTALHSEGDLFYLCKLHTDGTATVFFLEKASEYASDGETQTGEWGN